MSTFIEEKSQDSPLSDEKELNGYFAQFAKPRSSRRVGMEAEFFGVWKETGKALPYDGPVGIHEILKHLARNFHYNPVYENGNIIALIRGENSVTLEPGGQVELSASPVKTVFEIEEQIRSFIEELHSVSVQMPEVAWLTAGMQPFSRIEEVVWVPKKRYEIMARHFQARGTLSHYMMKMTATNQVNFDYVSEEHAMSNLRLILGITSIVSAMFANSGFSEGRLNGFETKRLEIWNNTDPDRTGLIEEFLKPDRTFRDYLNYILNMPLIFIVRNHDWIPVGKMNFRQFIRNGFEGHSPTLGDFELHLSTAFPEARLKKYLEVRGVDCQSPDLIPSVAAFWKGILYDNRTADAAWKLVAFASSEDWTALHREVPEKGLRARLRKSEIAEIARELVDLSCSSLAGQVSDQEARSECAFLERIRDRIIRPGKSPSQIISEKWEGEFRREPKNLINYLSV